MKIRLFLQWMLFSALAVTLHAESVKFTAVSLGETLTDLEYNGGSSSEKLTIPAFSRSEIRNYSGGPLMEFYTTVVKDGKKVKLPVAQVTLPKKTSQVLLVFSPQSDGTAKVQPLDDTQVTMPSGSARFFNATPTPIGIQYNADSVVLSPNEQTIVPAPPPQMVMKVVYQKQGRWVRGICKVFAADNDMRQTIFIVISDSDRFKVHTPAGFVTLTPLQSFSLPELVKTESPQDPE